MKRAVGTAQPPADLAAVAVAHQHQHPATIVRGLELDLRDLRQPRTEQTRVSRSRRSEAVEPRLLIEVAILLGPLAGCGIARVPQAGSVGRPRDAAAGGAFVDARQAFTQLASA